MRRWPDHVELSVYGPRPAGIVPILVHMTHADAQALAWALLDAAAAGTPPAANGGPATESAPEAHLFGALATRICQVLTDHSDRPGSAATLTAGIAHNSHGVGILVRDADEPDAANVLVEPYNGEVRAHAWDDACAGGDPNATVVLRRVTPAVETPPMAAGSRRLRQRPRTEPETEVPTMGAGLVVGFVAIAIGREPDFAQARLALAALADEEVVARVLAHEQCDPEDYLYASETAQPARRPQR